MTRIADAFIPTGAYIGLGGYLICGIVCVAIFWGATRAPATDDDRRCDLVDQELDAAENRERRSRRATARPLDSVTLLVFLYAGLFVAAAYAAVSTGLGGLA